MKSRHVLVSASLAIVMGSSSLAVAQTVVTESAAYSAISALLLANTSGANGGECAATSLINSFQFLQNTYPSVYGTAGSLTMGTGTANATAAREALDGNIANPRLQGDVWNAKLNWIANKAPGTTTVTGITNTTMTSSQGTAYAANPPAGIVGGRNMTFAASASSIWTFIQQQIKEGEDVEIGLYNHMTTVMGYATSGANLYLEIIDPNDPTGADRGATGAGGLANGPVGEWVNATTTGRLVGLSGFSVSANYYSTRSNGPTGTANIFYAFAESPVPEPSAFVAIAGLTVTGVGVAYRRRRRKLSTPSTA